MEDNLSMPELTAILSAKREQEHNQNKFNAAIQGIDLDEASGGQKEWEDLKARAFAGVGDSKDILSLQGINAQQAGFGIGMGLDYGGNDTVNPLG